MKTLVSILLIIMTCLSCSKKEEEVVSKDCGSPDGTIKQCLYNFFFDEGSYWVYQDTINVQYDSSYVDSWNMRLEAQLNGPGCGYEGQYIDINYISSYNGAYSEIMGDEHINSGDGRYRYWCGGAPLDSLVVSSTTYYNVLETFPPDYDGILYYKEGVGVVRKVYFNAPIDTVTLDLVNYHVNLFTNPF